MSDDGVDVHTQADRHTENLDNITLTFWELMRFVETLKISHHAETYQAKQMHKAVTETILRMDKEARAIPTQRPLQQREFSIISHYSKSPSRAKRVFHHRPKGVFHHRPLQQRQRPFQLSSCHSSKGHSS
ncbi:hypothetical protein ACLOJK_019772 [Asimina triloba]